jgi:amino acid transporter
VQSPSSVLVGPGGSAGGGVPTLLRVVGRWDLTCQGINIVLASSVFVLPAITLSDMGGWSPLAVFAAAVGVLFVLLSFGEAAGRYRQAGGPYRYASDAFGDYVGAQIGLLYWVVRATATASVANVFVIYVGELWPGAAHFLWRALLLTAVIWAGGWINLRGTRQAASILNVITLAKALPLIALVVAGAFWVSWDRLTATALPGSHVWARSILLWVFAYGGFEATVIPASEARDPTRDIPLALLQALGMVAVLYVAVQFVVAGVLHGAPGPRPVAEVATIVAGRAGALVIAIAALIATNGHIAGSILASSRITYAVAERGALPRVLAHVHPRFKTPDVSIVLFTLVAWGLAISGSFVWNASISAVGRLIVYVATAGAALKLRRVEPSSFSPPAWTHVVTIAFCAWLFMHQTAAEALVIGIVLVAGSALWLAYRLWRR